MAKIFRPLFSDEATGGFANVLYYKKGVNYAIVSKKKTNIFTSSESQDAQRSLFKAACLAWSAQTDNTKTAWHNTANRPVSAFNLFVGQYLLLGTTPPKPFFYIGHQPSVFLIMHSSVAFYKPVNIYR